MSKINMKVKSKAGLTTMQIDKSLHAEIVALRTGMFPKRQFETLSGFVQEMVKFYKKGHCPECTQENVTFNACTCKKSERL
jgi:peroxiredoxin